MLNSHREKNIFTEKRHREGMRNTISYSNKVVGSQINKDRQGSGK